MTTAKRMTAVIKFDTGGRRWSIKLPWELHALETVLGKRLPLDYVYGLDLDGRTLVLHEWGATLHINRPGTNDVVEILYPLWKFSFWLDFMGRQGTPRSQIVGADGLQALELHAQYSTWASYLDKLTAAFYIEIYGVKPAEIIAVSPELADDVEFQAYLGSLLLKGRLPKGRGRHQMSKPAHVRYLGAIALNICRSAPVRNMLAACREACELRPDWVPRRWQVGEAKPGEHLYRALRKIGGTKVDDILNLEEHPRGLKYKPPYSK